MMKRRWTISLLLILGLTACDPRDLFGPRLPDVYLYKSYNTEGEKVADGWIQLILDPDGKIHGEYDLDLEKGIENVGPQDGSGDLAGTWQNDTLWVNLNPGWADNNVLLFGTLQGRIYKGRWEWSTFSGVSAAGTFEAIKRD